MAEREAARTGVVVSHTHWDRAWYLPFEAFRVRLVRLVDRVLDLLDAEPRFRAFALDGQTVLLEDYLELRPERAACLRRHVASGRLLVGPWYVSPDLFLVSGEALVRNLQRGLRMAEAFGAAMPVGYVPDPFGHPAQMPQLMRGVGIGHYVFMRGLSAETRARVGSVFEWAAPDGSAVRAVYLRDGYFNAAALGHASPFGRHDGAAPDVERALAQVRATTEALADLQPDGPLLLLNGMDHMPEQADLPELLDVLNGRLDGIRLVHGTLPAFLDALGDALPERPVVSGDLLGNADHPTLGSVASARLYLKAQNHAAQSLLTTVAEPLALLARQRGGADARPFLDRAWRELLRCHPHDDICGCSADAVHLDDEAQFRHALEIGEAVAVEALEGLVLAGFEPGPGETSAEVFVWNPHPWPQRVRVRADVLVPSPEGEAGPPPTARPLAATDGGGRPVGLAVLATEAPVMRVAYLEQTWGRRYSLALDVDTPALGYTVVRVAPAPGPEAQHCESPPLQHSARPHGTLEAEGLRLRATPTGLALEASGLGLYLGDLLRFAYDADAGDTYSFSPVPERPTRWAAFVGAAPHPSDPHRLVARFELAVPESLDSDAEVTLAVTAEIEIEPSGHVAFGVRYLNTARDGRLRAVLPTGLHAETALAGALFGLAERRRPTPLAPEDAPERYAAYPGELVYTTQHHEDVVAVEGEAHTAWLADRGLPEYELLATPDGAALALTLHRAVGALSRPGGRVRRCGAGPALPTPGAQCLREIRAAFAFGVAAASRTEVLRRARAFAHPAWARELPALPHAPADGPHPRAASLLALENPAVQLLSLRDEPDGPGAVARLLNLTGTPQTVRLAPGGSAARACETDLRERWDDTRARAIGPEGLDVVLGPHRVQTVVIRLRPGRDSARPNV